VFFHTPDEFFFATASIKCWIASCENKETARRAIFLRSFVSDLPKQKQK